MPTTFSSRAVEVLVELHEVELRQFLSVWERFVASICPLPEARGDADYASQEQLCTHVVRAARSYLIWIGEQVGRPVSGVDMTSEPREIAPRLRPFGESVLSAYRSELAVLTDDELQPPHRTKWNIDLPIEAMLEHAVVHPMRHRIQLERILKNAGR